MIILASAISEGYGGVQVVNRLVLAAAEQSGIPGSVIALHDSPGARWTDSWQSGWCAGGSRVRFAAAALARRVDARNSVILVTHVGLTPVGRLLKQVVRAKLVVFLYGVEAWRPLPARTIWALERCDRVVAISQYTLSRCRSENPRLRRMPGEVCYLPARPLINGSHARQQVAAPSRRLRVLVVGRLWGRGLLKGQRELISLWPQVIAEFPDVELCVVGDGDGRKELETLARAHGVERAVRFTGAVPDDELSRLYAASDVFAMPSRGEGFGLVFAEAMAHGLPCIASRADAGSEVVAGGETGIVVDPGSPQELWKALRTLLSDFGLRRRMGEAGRRRAAEVFSVEDFNRRIQALLRDP